MTTSFPTQWLMSTSNYEGIVELRDELADNQLQRIDDALVKEITSRENSRPNEFNLHEGLSYVDDHTGHVRVFKWKGRNLLQTVWDNGDIRITHLSSISTLLRQ
jgi:hypothetical protein